MFLFSILTYHELSMWMLPLVHIVFTEKFYIKPVYFYYRPKNKSWKIQIK